MFVYNKSLERTGTIEYENDATPILESGLKVYDAPTHITGTVRFVVARRKNKIIPTKDGRTKVDELVTQFGWDEIKQLEDTGIQLEAGNLKLNFDGLTFRLTDITDFGQAHDRNYRPLGIKQAIFQREVTKYDY